MNFKTFIILYSLIIFASCSIKRIDKNGAMAGDKNSKWELIWYDEFNYKGLPDSTKWSYEEGFVRNRELQYYTKARKENVRVEEGFLVIESRKEKVRNPNFHPDSSDWRYSRESAEYTSASINTKVKAGFMYGRIEAGIQLPHGSGVWPAFWTLGVNHSEVKWPTCGEIDILEYFGGERPNRIESNMHYGIGGKRHHRQGVVELNHPPEGFHVYAIEWYEGQVDFYFDDNKYWTFPVNLADDGSYNSYRNPHYILLNFALGGAAASGEVDESLLPQKYLVDYVRVYKLK